MKKNVMTLLAVLTLASMAQASGDPFPREGAAGTTVSTISSFIGTTVDPSHSSNNHKEITEAKEDIAYFVSSEGQVRTARFEKALAYTKQNFNVANASDMEISQALLTEF